METGAWELQGAQAVLARAVLPCLLSHVPCMVSWSTVGREIPQQPGSHRHTPGQGGGSTEPFTPALLAPHVSMALHHLSPKNTTRDSLLTVASSPTQGKHQAALALPLPVTITKHEASPAEVPPKAACSACFGPSPVAAT